MTPKIKLRSLRTAAVLGAAGLAASLAVAIPLASHAAHTTGHGPVATPAGPSPRPNAIAAGPVELVPGAHWKDGLWLGYPRTQSGALSAGLEYTTAVVESLDPDRLRAVLADVLAPGERIAAGLAAAVRSDRALVGAPATGPLPAGAALVLTGRMYQLLDFNQSQAHLLLLFTMQASGPGAPDLSGKAMILPVRLRWAVGDWKLSAWDRGPSYRSLIAPPDSASAYGEGWLDLPSAADGPGSWS